MYVMRHGDNHKASLLWMVAVFLVVTMSCTMGCSPWQVGAEKDVVKNGIKFDTFRENDDGTKMGILAEDMVIDGWPVKKDFIVFYPDWRLDELQVSRDYARNGVFMPAGTWVFPDKKGNPGVCIFPRDVEVQGHLCRGSGTGKEGFMTAFYASGKLHWFYSRDPVVVDGVTCKDSLFEAVYLHPDGRLQQCKLDKAVTIEGVEYRRGFIIHFDQAGKVRRK